jgi:hypothetical protein
MRHYTQLLRTAVTAALTLVAVGGAGEPTRSGDHDSEICAKVGPSGRAKADRSRRVATKKLTRPSASNPSHPSEHAGHHDDGHWIDVGFPEEDRACCRDHVADR